MAVTTCSTLLIVNSCAIKIRSHHKHPSRLNCECVPYQLCNHALSLFLNSVHNVILTFVLGTLWYLDCKSSLLENLFSNILLYLLIVLEMMSLLIERVLWVFSFFCSFLWWDKIQFSVSIEVSRSGNATMPRCISWPLSYLWRVKHGTDKCQLATQMLVSIGSDLIRTFLLLSTMIPTSALLHIFLKISPILLFHLVTLLLFHLWFHIPFIKLFLDALSDLI